MKTPLVVIVFFMLTGTTWAATDWACMQRCQTAGSTYGYCREACSYGNSTGLDIYVPPVDFSKSLTPGQVLGPAIEQMGRNAIILQQMRQQQQELELQRQQLELQRERLGLQRPQAQQGQARQGQAQELPPREKCWSHCMTDNHTNTGEDCDKLCTPDTQYVGGKYKLKNYKIQYPNGQVLTENDVKMSGELEIIGRGLKAVIIFGNQTTKGEGKIVNQDNTSGTYTLKSGSDAGMGDFRISPDNSITLHSKRILDKKEVESWATWVRYSD